MNHVTKKKVSRDKEAVAKTLHYLREVRQGQPTSIGMAAKAMHVNTTTMGQRFSRLVTKGQAQKLARGLFSSLPEGKVSRATLSDLLEHLKKEREQLDAKIVRVQEALDIHQEWTKQ